MSILDKVKASVSEDARKAEFTLKQMEAKVDTTQGAKVLKYVLYALAAIVVLGLGSCMFKACTMSPQEHKAYINENYVQPQAQQPVAVAPQPVVVQGNSGAGDMALGYIIGRTMSNGQVYNGHNAPTTVVNNRTYIIRADGSKVSPTTPAVVPPVVKPVAPVAPIVAPVRTAQPSPFQRPRTSSWGTRPSYSPSSLRSSTFRSSSFRSGRR